MTSLLDPAYRAVQSGDLPALEELLLADIFMLTPEAGGVLISRREVLSLARERLPAGVRIDVEQSLAGEAASGEGGWVFDQLRVSVRDDAPTTVRVTALVVPADGVPAIAACYWSIPFATQDEQDAEKHAGRLDPGVLLPEDVRPDALPLAASLGAALAEPERIPDLYSARAEHATIGSVTDEVFLGPAGRAVWAEFVAVVSLFRPRGPMCGALVTDDLGWLAANIDIGEPATPYRFFYVWLREPEGWRIVISHDAVSRPLAAAPSDGRPPDGGTRHGPS